MPRTLADFRGRDFVLQVSRTTFQYFSEEHQTRFTSLYRVIFCFVVVGFFAPGAGQVQSGRLLPSGELHVLLPAEDAALLVQGRAAREA